jgi:hypothetical protein
VRLGGETKRPHFETPPAQILTHGLAHPSREDAVEMEGRKVRHARQGREIQGLVEVPIDVLEHAVDATGVFLSAPLGNVIRELRHGGTLSPPGSWILPRMRSFQRKLASLALLLGLPAASLAADRSIPYKDMHAVFERLTRLQGGRYFKATAKLTSAEPSIANADIRLLIRSRSGNIPVPVAADGSVTFPVRPELLAENPDVMTNVPQGKLSMGLSMSVQAEPAERFRYQLGEDMRSEASETIARQGLMARMMLPDFDDFVIQFEKGRPAHATIEAKGGPVRLEADAEGRVVLPRRRDWKRENPFIQLSTMPQSISLQPG